MSKHVPELIRARRQEQIKADVAFLEKAIKKAPQGDPSDNEIAEIYASVRKKRRIKR